MGTSWLLAGAVATAQVGPDRAGAGRRRATVRGVPPASAGAVRGAAAALIVGWLRPAPWLLALLLVAILSAVWSFAVSRFLRADAWGERDLPAPGAYVAGVEEAAAVDPARPR